MEETAPPPTQPTADDGDGTSRHTSLRWWFIGLAVLLIGGAVGASGHFPEQDGHYGFWSVLPPLVAIVLAFWTREVISALFLGVARSI